MAEFQRLTEQLHRLTKSHGRFCVEECTEFGSHFIHGIRAHAHRYPLPRTHRIDRDGKWRNHTVDRRLFKEQRLSAAGRFHFTVGELGDLQFRRDGRRDAFQLPRPVECVDEIAK